MTFSDWVSESRQQFQDEPVLTAAKTSAKMFYRGIMRRTLDPNIGRPIWDRDGWDVCLVLDAARVDIMREAAAEYDELGDVGAAWSNASCSIDWINRQFNDYPGEAQRTGYVTANPFANHDEETVKSADLSEEKLGHFAPLYETHWQDVGGIETVPPEIVTDHAIDAWRRRDELGIDQLVVHYMQPHEPFRSRPEWGNDEHKLLDDLVKDDGTGGPSVYPRVESGDVDLDEFRGVYLDNHHWVLEDITARLLGNVEGEVAITADHGNGLGEWGSWHHPPAAVSPFIRRVPWVDLECTDKKTVDPQIQNQAGHVETSVETKLEALGYL